MNSLTREKGDTKEFRRLVLCSFGKGRMRERKWHGKLKEKKEGEKWNFEVCLTRLSFIKVITSVTHASIYSLVSFLKKLVLQM